MWPEKKSYRIALISAPCVPQIDIMHTRYLLQPGSIRNPAYRLDLIVSCGLHKCLECVSFRAAASGEKIRKRFCIQYVGFVIKDMDLDL